MKAAMRRNIEAKKVSGTRGNWYVMQGMRYGWETFKGPFESESEAQNVLGTEKHNTINPLRVMRIV